mmetsp:Transcript_24985/g.31471  ORF Transcript_24985/g.31471 Transcript_24985/m.31471 type:complete len:435 (+) Transcript_24985:3-1307(+)
MIEFTEELLQEYDALNKKLLDKMYSDLAEENPLDLSRREIMKSVLDEGCTHFCQSFKEKEFDKDELLEMTDSEDENNNTRFDIDDVDFKQWPHRASQLGFLSRESVLSRFVFDEEDRIEFGDDGNDGQGKDSFAISFSASSQRGYYPSNRNKANQDAYINGTVLTHKFGRGVLFSVFDGHGDDGDKCAIQTSNIVEEECEKLLRSYNGSADMESYVQKTFKDAYLKANSTLEENGYGETSGTTATSLYVTDDKGLHVANIGDSRCIVVSKNGEVTVLSRDHTPDREDEKERIISYGGFVMTSAEYDVMDSSIHSFISVTSNINEPLRVWSKEGKFPGCAFSRSIGDMNAKDLGITAEPEFMSSRIGEEMDSIILGSDGIFDFIPDQEIAEIALGEKDTGAICKALVGMSYNRWSESEERTDDITVIVIKLHLPC